MCGIAGFIGDSLHPNWSFRLITSLLEGCEVRGDDASGFWGTAKSDDSIVYHKEPIKSSDFIKKPVWKNLANIDLNMMLVHARGASQGSGSPLDNQNNHPFTSHCKTLGLVHNGRVPDNEYSALAKKFEVASKCDSEILLRIFESGIYYTDDECIPFQNVDSIMSRRLMGLRDIWSYVDKAHMAVAIGERASDNEKRLFLFRNRHRTLWLADVREELGQVFFFSTAEIWNGALKASGVGRRLSNRIKLIELPTEELWVLDINSTKTVVDKIQKYSIKFSGRTAWKPEGEPIRILRVEPQSEILTQLDQNDKVISQLADTEVIKLQDTVPFSETDTSVATEVVSVHKQWMEKQDADDPNDHVLMGEDEVLPNPWHQGGDDYDDCDISVLEVGKSKVTQQSQPQTHKSDVLSFYKDQQKPKSLIGLPSMFDACDNILKIVQYIRDTVSEKAQEEDISQDRLCEIIQSLEDAKVELAGTEMIIKSN